MGALYRIYFKQVLPRVGTVISGVRGPYAYLPASVERFPPPDEMLARMKAPDSRKPVGRRTPSALRDFIGGKLLSVLQQFAQCLNVVSADVSNHKIPQPALRPVFHVERHGVRSPRR